MVVKRFIPSRYVPTTSRSGNESATLFRAVNWWVRGRGSDLYAESVKPPLDLSETIPTETLTGTITFTTGSRTITGTTTAFFAELHLSQTLETLAGEVIVVDEIISDTSFTAQTKPLTNETGVVAHRLPIMFEVGKKRGTLLSGSAFETDKGTVLCVGSGTLHLNGTALNATLVATKTPKMAIYDPTTNLYTIHPMGFVGVPTGITASAVAGGTRGQLAGDYSFRFQKNNSVTGGYGNPSEKITVTLTAGQKTRFTDIPVLSAGDIADGWDSWRINANKNGGSTALNAQSYANGPWYWVKTIFPATRTDVDATLRLSTIAGAGTDNDYELEYLDAEIDGTLKILTFDNDGPPEAEFIGTVAGYPVLGSCFGKRTTTNKLGSSPGPFIVPAKPNNIEAFPVGSAVPLSPPEVILGQYMVAGRLYLLTPNTLQIAVFTTDPDFPVGTRPFWKAGFRNPYAICFINGRLYGFTSAGAMRSAEDGEEGSEEHAFAADVEEKMRSWDASRTFVVEDPVNECACYVHSAAYKNDAGFWVSEMYPFMVRQEGWGPLQTFSSDTHDMVISGTATVNGKFEFLAGGRDGIGGIAVKTYRFDEGSDQDVESLISWQFSDDGVEDRPKKIKYPRVIAKLQNANFGIHGTNPGEIVDVAALEAGNAGSKTGAITLAVTTDVTVYDRLDLELEGVTQYTPCIVNTWDGNGERDRIDEISMEVLVEGGRR